LDNQSNISGAQIRAARALLGLSAADLAHLADVSWATIQRFESDDGIPANKAGTLQRVKEVLEAAGITFTGDPVSSPGLQLQRPTGKARSTARAKRAKG